MPKRQLALVILPPWDATAPHLGVACVADFMRTRNWSVSVVDLNALAYESFSGTQAARLLLEGRDPLSWLEPRYAQETGPLIRPLLHAVADEIAAYNPPIVGLSCSTWFSGAVAEELVHLIRDRRPETLLVAGGACLFKNPAHASLSQQGLEYRFSREGFDYLVHGEGQQSLYELAELVVDGVDEPERLAAVPGVVPWRASSGDPYERFSPRPPEQDLSRYRFPTFEEFQIERYSCIPLLMSKGCIRKCRFCNEHERNQKFGYRSIPADLVFKAIARHAKSGRNVFVFNDLLINADLGNLERLGDLIIDSGLEITWTGRGIVRDDMTPGLLEKLRRAGLAKLTYGVESFSDETLRRMGKPHDAATALAVLRMTREAGIDTAVNIIVGFPGETGHNLVETKAAIEEHGPAVMKSVSVTTCMVISDNDLGINPHKYGIDLPLPHTNPELTWTGSGGNTFEKRLDRLHLMSATLTRLGYQIDPGDRPDIPDCLLVYLPQGAGHAEAAGCRERFREWSGSIETKSNQLGIRTGVVDLYEALELSLGRQNRRGLTKRTGSHPTDEEFGDLLARLVDFPAAGNLPAELEQCIDRLVCDGAPCVVLWLPDWRNQQSLRFAAALRDTAPEIVLLAAGGGPPPEDVASLPFSGWLAAPEAEAIHHLIQQYRADNEVSSTGGLKVFADRVRIDPWGLRRVVLTEFTVSPLVELRIRFNRPSRPLRFLLGFHDFRSQPAGDDGEPFAWNMPPGRVKAGSSVILRADLTSRRLSQETRSYMSLRALEPLPTGELREVLHERRCLQPVRGERTLKPYRGPRIAQTPADNPKRLRDNARTSLQLEAISSNTGVTSGPVYGERIFRFPNCGGKTGK